MSESREVAIVGVGQTDFASLYAVRDAQRDEVAVVTGGGRGVGRGIARALAAEGVKVVVNDLFRDGAAAPADEVVAEIRTVGGEAAADGHDVSTFAGNAEIIDAAVATYGRVDILVLCAGTSSPT